jgi:Tfp pilus assembly protein PilF
MKIKYLVCTVCFFILHNVAFTQNQAAIMESAHKLAEVKKYDQALILMNKAWKMDTTNYLVNVERGNIYVYNNIIDSAYHDYTRAIKLQPDSAMAYVQRGLLLMSLIESDLAITDFTTALNWVSEDSLRLGVYINRGAARGQKRDFQGAYEDYSRALMIDSMDIGALNNIAAVLDELGRRDEAIQYLKRIIIIQPTFVGGFVNLGFVYSLDGKYAESIVYFNKALEIEKDEPTTLNNRGFSKYKLKDYTGAMADINKSISLYPGNSYAYKNRALVYLALKQNDKACKDLQTAISQGFTKMYGSEVDDLIRENCKQ